MMTRLSPGVLVVAAALAGPATAAAAPPEGAASPAQTLFDRGVADMESGRFEKACPAIEASQRTGQTPLEFRAGLDVRRAFLPSARRS